MRFLTRHLTYANAVASLALFVALGGAGYAASQLPRNSVGSAQIKSGAVTNTDLAANAVTGAKVKAGSLDGTDLRVGSIGPAQIDVTNLPAVPSAKSAATATTATTATTAKTADAAKTADTAKTADAAKAAVTATGLAKVTYAVNSAAVAAGDSAFIVASCPAGQVVIGGGTEVDDYDYQGIVESFPNGTNAWGGGAYTSSTASGPKTFWVHAICVPASATG